MRFNARRSRPNCRRPLALADMVSPRYYALLPLRCRVDKNSGGSLAIGKRQQRRIPWLLNRSFC
jgi:hypothetical protein